MVGRAGGPAFDQEVTRTMPRTRAWLDALSGQRATATVYMRGSGASPDATLAAALTAAGVLVGFLAGLYLSVDAPQTGRPASLASVGSATSTPCR
jgi:hypothetical protein